MGWRAAHGPPQRWGCEVKPGGHGLWVPIARPQSVESSVHKAIAASCHVFKPNHGCCEEQLPVFAPARSLAGSPVWVPCSCLGREGRLGSLGLSPLDTPRAQSAQVGERVCVSREPWLITEMSPPP